MNDPAQLVLYGAAAVVLLIYALIETLKFADRAARMSFASAQADRHCLRC